MTDGRDTMRRLSGHKRHNRSGRKSQFAALRLEELEDRTLLAINCLEHPAPLGCPHDWLPRGPAPLEFGQTEGIVGNSVSGAVQAIAAHPNDAATIFIGTVNGGIWRTTTLGASWEPLTDQFPSLSIGALTFDRADPTGNTIYAGLGSFSSGHEGSTQGGILKTTNALATTPDWSLVGASTFGTLRVTAIATSNHQNIVGPPQSDVVLVATTDFNHGGIYRSVDGGESFVPVATPASDQADNDGDGNIDEPGEGLPAGDVTSLITDPEVPARFF